MTHASRLWCRWRLVDARGVIHGSSGEEPPGHACRWRSTFAGAESMLAVWPIEALVTNATTMRVACFVAGV